MLTPQDDLPFDEDDGLNAALQTLVVGVTGLDGTLVRPRWQRTPPPSPNIVTNWCAIGAMTTTPDDSPYMEHVDPTGPVDNTGYDRFQRHEMIDVLASFYGPKARTFAGLLRDGLNIEQNRWALTQAGMGVHHIGRVTFLPEQIGQEWRLRSDLFLSFSRQLDRIYLVRSLLTAPVTFP